MHNSEYINYFLFWDQHKNRKRIDATPIPDPTAWYKKVHKTVSITRNRKIIFHSINTQRFTPPFTLLIGVGLRVNNYDGCWDSCVRHANCIFAKWLWSMCAVLLLFCNHSLNLVRFIAFGKLAIAKCAGHIGCYYLGNVEINPRSMNRRV